MYPILDTRVQFLMNIKPSKTPYLGETLFESNAMSYEYQTNNRKSRKK